MPAGQGMGELEGQKKGVTEGEVVPVGEGDAGSVHANPDVGDAAP